MATNNYGLAFFICCVLLLALLAGGQNFVPPPGNNKMINNDRAGEGDNKGNLISLLTTLHERSTRDGEIKENCTYAVTIETTCTKGAETSNHISLRFGDTNSNDILISHLNSKHIRRVDPLEPEVLDDVPRKPFQACMVDEFQVQAQCVDSPVCYLYLKLAGADDWRPGFAQVHVLDGSRSHLSSGNFYFRRYLPRRVWHGLDACDKEVTRFGIKHKRKVSVKKPAKKYSVNSLILFHSQLSELNP